MNEKMRKWVGVATDNSMHGTPYTFACIDAGGFTTEERKKATRFESAEECWKFIERRGLGSKKKYEEERHRYLDPNSWGGGRLYTSMHPTEIFE